MKRFQVKLRYVIDFTEYVEADYSPGFQLAQDWQPPSGENAAENLAALIQNIEEGNIDVVSITVGEVDTIQA